MKPLFSCSFFSILFFFGLGIMSLQAQEIDSLGVEDSIFNDLKSIKAVEDPSQLQKDLNKNSNVASHKALPLRETPSIVSYITAKDIEAINARDLMDVLYLVQGFDFAQDVDLMIGLGIRGNWSNEGKVLLMIDGIPINEILFQTIQFGNHFPVDLISKIEIIRGPGSAVYGGAAEYGVINIITKNPEEIGKLFISANYGHLSTTWGRTNFYLGMSKRFKDGSISLLAQNGFAQKSESLLGRDSSAVDLRHQTKSDPLFLSLKGDYKGIQFKLMYDSYKNYSHLYGVHFNSLSTEIRYQWQVSKKLKITPSVSYLYQLPWEYKKFFVAEDYFYKVRARRLFSEVNGNYDISRKINLTSGFIFFADFAKDLHSVASSGWEDKKKYDFYNFAAYSQLFVRHRIANLTVGARYDKHNAYGASFVPRIALTKKIEDFHFKILASQAFRSPSISNIIFNAAIKPEKSNIFELEMGYQFTPNMLLATNIFYINTNAPIVYFSGYVDSLYTEGYSNMGKTGSRGIESEYRYKNDRFSFALNYALYAANNADSSYYAVDEHKNAFLGFAQQKITCNTSINITENLSFNANCVYLGKRYGYTLVDIDTGEGVLGEVAPTFLLNTSLICRNIFYPRLNFNIGVFDVFNQRTPMLQGYNGGYEPFRYMGREVFVKISYSVQ